MATRSIKLNRSLQEHVVEGRTQGYRLIVTATEPSLITDAIFLYSVGMPASLTGDRTARFVAVCSPSDIEQYQADTPATGDSYYRLAEIDCVFRAVSLADLLWAAVNDDVEELVHTLNLMDEMAAVDSVVIDGLE